MGVPKREATLGAYQQHNTHREGIVGFCDKRDSIEPLFMADALETGDTEA